MVNIVNKINEIVIKKLTLKEYLNKNKGYLFRKFEDLFNMAAEEVAISYGFDPTDDDFVDQYSEYDEGEEVKFYEDYAHAFGYDAHYQAAECLISHIHTKYDYKKGDEKNEEKQLLVLNIFGYDPKF